MCSEHAVLAAELNDDTQSIRVYACSGLWPSSTPGLEAGAARLCGDGYHLCTSTDMDSADYDTCNSADLGGFFASDVSSIGNWNCDPGNPLAQNDLWGCGAGDQCKKNKGLR
jgi:hypothetical protein